ncbi:MAG: RHS repeat-associated core domain-containing protein [Sphingobacteriales bacterium]|nr:MAG: RHS repeat-associated core domain-containing protein [Sphingobacteriales bacterium]
MVFKSCLTKQFIKRLIPPTFTNPAESMPPPEEPPTNCDKRDYIGAVEYDNNIAEAYYHEEGRINLLPGMNLRHEYSLRDHLGNTRICFTDSDNDGDPEILQQTNYYPFGLPIQELSTTFDGEGNNYQYNGKELNEDFGLHWMDYGARWYDPQINRWGQIDPLAEKFYHESPYVYVGNNPVVFIDPRGMSRTWYFSESGQMIGSPSNDNLPDAVVVIPNSQVADFRDLRESGVFGDYHSNASNQNLRTQGITYLTGGLLEFADKYGKGGNDNVTYDNDKIISMTHNGKPVEGGFFAEWGIRLGLTPNGEVFAKGIGYTDGAFNYVSPQFGEAGNAHLHPMPGDYEILVGTGDKLQPRRNHPVEGHAGPSDQDRFIESSKGNRYHNIAIDPKNMYLYRSEKTIYVDGKRTHMPASNITVPLELIR